MMKPQARHEVVRAVLPALAGAALMAVLWWAEVWVLDYFVRDQFWIKHIGAIPDVFWNSDGETFPSISTDFRVFYPWALACAFFAVGPLVAFMCSRGKAAHAFSLALLLGVITHGCVNVVSFLAFCATWNGTPLTIVKLVRWDWPGFAWILALSLGGAAVGISVPRVARAVARRADRRKMPAQK